MDRLITLTVDLSIIALFLAGVRQFRSPKGALRGNLTAAAALGLAVLVVALRDGVGSGSIVFPALLAGSLAGWILAARVGMVQIPAMVAFQHGAGGVAAFLVSAVELVRASDHGLSVATGSGTFGLILGAATFSGSLVAAGKLANRLRQTPTVLAGHGWWTTGIIAAIVILSASSVAWTGSGLVWLLSALILVSAALGVVVSIRIGGADMPVLISFLNATAGLAAAFCGIVIGNRLLVASGATVAASGTILTLAMCRAMNRNLLAVFRGFQPDTGHLEPVLKAEPPEPPELPERRVATTVTERAVAACLNAHSVVIAPGYGMAMAGAQFAAVALGRILEDLGKEVRYAVHPVAGRMPGHMHVLLAEAEVPYAQLCEPADINPGFAKVDLAVVIGASDVVNPAAATMKGTPISGMPILHVGEARSILILNLDDSPGYSGVRNLLYDRPEAILMWGDAKLQLQQLIRALNDAGSRQSEPADQLEQDPASLAAS